MKLPRLDQDNARRREIAQLYKEGIDWQRLELQSTVHTDDINEAKFFISSPSFLPAEMNGNVISIVTAFVLKFITLSLPIARKH